MRMKQYRDELLAACLNFILALPKEIIEDQMTEVVPAIQVFTSNSHMSFDSAGNLHQSTCIYPSNCQQRNDLKNKQSSILVQTFVVHQCSSVKKK